MCIKSYNNGSGLGGLCRVVEFKGGGCATDVSVLSSYQKIVIKQFSIALLGIHLSGLSQKRSNNYL